MGGDPEGEMCCDYISFLYFAVLLACHIFGVRQHNVAGYVTQLKLM